MGPQSFDCGKAQTFRRKSALAWLQWGRSLSTAERLVQVVVVVDAKFRFNGAAVFRLRKGAQQKEVWKCNGCFNGAAVFRLRKASTPATFRLPMRCFNGAAVFRLRKDQRQRGGRGREGLASMGPQSFDCGKNNYESRPTPAGGLQWGRSLSTAESGRPRLSRFARHGFNGAAVFRLRKGPCKHLGENTRLASMGPQSFDCGKRHAFLEYRPEIVASMGPQSFDCGKCATCDKWEPLPAASMGPQSFDCGKPACQPQSKRAGELQWGRSLSTAESERSEPAEKSLPCFNGAAVFRLRKESGQ